MIDYKGLKPKDKLWVFCSDLSETFEQVEYYPDLESKENGVIRTVLDGQCQWYLPESLFLTKNDMIDSIINQLIKLKEKELPAYIKDRLKPIIDLQNKMNQEIIKIIPEYYVAATSESKMCKLCGMQRVADGICWNKDCDYKE